MKRVLAFITFEQLLNYWKLFEIYGSKFPRYRLSHHNFAGNSPKAGDIIYLFEFRMESNEIDLMY